MKKQLMASLLAAAMLLSVTGCGAPASSEAAAPATQAPTEAAASADTTAADDTAALQAALDELAATLDGTCWVGMDSMDYSCYVMGFGEGKVAVYSNVEGDEGVEGYWNIGADSLYVYDDEACTNQILEIPWDYDETNDVMVLNDRAIMSQVEGDIDTAAEAMEQYALAAQVGEFLDSTVWAGVDTDGTMVMAFTLQNDEYYLGLMDAAGNTEEHEGSWSIDYDSIYLYENDALLDTLSWDIAEDGSELYFTVDSSQLTFALFQTDAESVTDSLTAIATEVFAA